MHCLLLLLLLLLGTAPPAFSQVSTYFIDEFSSFNGLGAYWTQGFTVDQRSTFVLRTTSDYKTQTGIFPSSQLSNFTNNRGVSGFGLFTDTFGTKYVTLNPGEYFVGIRNRTSGSTPYRIELDRDIILNPSSQFIYTYVDNYISGSQNVSRSGGRLEHGFTIQNGFRYYLDGCNTGLETYIIPASQLSNFRNNSSFEYYTDYSGTTGALPGLYELNLPPGGYYLAFRNEASNAKPVTYNMERWREVAMTSANTGNAGGSSGGFTTPLEIQGSVSWSASGTSINIRANNIVHSFDSGYSLSGSLRLRVWAVRSPYSGGSLRGYLMGTRQLRPLSQGTQYTSIFGNVTFTRPPRGSYYNLMTLEEYTSSGWFIVDYVNFSGTTRF